MYTYGWLSVLAMVAFIVLRRQLGNVPALLACTLLAFPFVDILLDGARIDTPQAAFQGLALRALTHCGAYRREPRAAVIGTFVIMYVSAFVGRANRQYFMVAPAAALCLFVGYGWAELSKRLARLSWPGRAAVAPWARWAWVPIALLIVQRPARDCRTKSLRVSPTVEISRWIEANVPAGTRLFHLGGRPYGTYLMGMSEKVHASWGDHFQYGRHRYPFFKEAFHLAYTN